MCTRHDIWRGGALLPTVVITASGIIPWVTSVVATMLLGEGPFLPASIALFTLLAVSLIITTCTMTATRISSQQVEIAGVVLLVFLLPLDWGLACARGGSAEGWPFALLTILTMAASAARISVCLSCIAGLGLWLAIRSIEDSFPFGLYSPFEGEAASRCGLSDISDMKCSEGWEQFVVSLGSRLVPVMTCAALCIGTINTTRQVMALRQTILATEIIVWELVKFNMDTASRALDVMIEDENYEEGLKTSLGALVNALRLYKSYLPQSVVVMDPVDETVPRPDLLTHTYSMEHMRNNTRGEIEELPPPSPPVVHSVTVPMHLDSKPSIPDILPGLFPSKSADTVSSFGGDQQEKELARLAELQKNWLDMPGHLRPKFATLLLIEIDLDLDSVSVGGPGGMINVFVKKVIETARAFDGVTLYVEANRVLVSWNTHKPHHQHAAAACGCALELDVSLRDVDFPAWYGISVASGTFFVGSAGVKDQMAPIVIGQNTSILAGMVALSRQIKTRVLILDKVYVAVRTIVDARPVDTVKSADQWDTIVVYELLGTKTSPSGRASQLYVEAFSMLRQLRLLECKAKLVEYLAMFRDDDQALRLFRISSWLHTEPSRLSDLAGTGYHRTQCRVWEDYEGKSEDLGAGLVLPEETEKEDKDTDELSESESGNGGVPRLASSSNSSTGSGLQGSIHRKWSFKSGRSVRSGSGASIGRRATTTADSSTGKLRQQLIEAQSAQRQKEEDDEPITTTTKDAVPLQFSDTNDRTWFRSDRTLGKGAFGDVWLGMSAMGGLVAMKVMKLPAFPEDEVIGSPLAGSLSNRSAASDAPPAMPALTNRRRSRRNNSRNARNQVKELLQEVSMLETLRHDNVVGYLGSCVFGRHVLIVMEYLSGGSLARVVQEFNNKLPQTSIRRYTRDIVHGLAFLHDNDIVHRDLKPHNVLMTNEGECKLADFGTATLLSEVTQSSQVTGTPLYMSPEACGGSIDQRSDIWSLGILFCQLFTGSVPYDIPDFVGQAFIYKLKTDKNLVPTIPKLPEDAEAFAKSCLTRDPEERANILTLEAHPFLLA
eukprot:TRINITY_DN4796_c0_g3_i1.p1 TRINITY_DN4796_c0_g3~~TRINITY_DN4796_c0_g3_i1.p1  ORF type:complete len:1060 (+),score=174.07 TRINITY_DN4796_c0_g3_i1:69-3248(+)